mmetsp:Transcript_41231/g.129165  ORF Transcript_41231/g.129165 Transcript_41231/m.129165 type:complete len:385 (+) Transcript_41231:860-2014(+)
MEPRVALVARLRRRDHDAHGDLARHVRGEVDGRDLVDLLDDIRMDVGGLEVAAAEAALAVGALGDCVEGHELHLVRPGLAHGGEHLLAGDERARAVHVLLVHLVGEEHEALLVRERAELGELHVREAVAGGVTRVDEHHGAHVDALAARVLDGLAHRVQVQGPARRLVELVRHERAVVQADGGRVQRVLRDGHEHAVLHARVRRTHAHLEEHADALARAVREEHVVRAPHRSAVAPRYELRHLLAHAGQALAVRVRAHVGHVRHVLLRPRDHVVGERGARRRVLELLGIEDEAQHLPVEAQRPLPQRLRVADVARHGLGERHLLPAGQRRFDLAGLGHDGPAHRILRGLDLIVHGRRAQARRGHRQHRRQEQRRPLQRHVAPAS